MPNSKKLKSPFPNNQLELELLASGFTRIVGIDEAGRGSWAGPVMVGAYVYDLHTQLIEGVNDSKQVKPLKRAAIYQKLIQSEYKLVSANNDLIDKLGVGQAIEVLIGEIIAGFDEQTYFLIDGYFVNNWGIPQRLKLVKKGDTKHYSIAAGSIIAKVSRDSEMTKLADVYPGYGFAAHFGYGTALHLQNLTKLGVTKIHRRSYAPIAKIISSQY